MYAYNSESIIVLAIGCLLIGTSAAIYVLGVLRVKLAMRTIKDVIAERDRLKERDDLMLRMAITCGPWTYASILAANKAAETSPQPPASY